MKVELGLPAVQPPSTYAEVNAEVEESHRDERGEKLQHRGTQQKVPRVIELCETLILWYTASAHRQFPEYYGRAIKDKGQHPDSNHLDYGLMSPDLPCMVTYLHSKYKHKSKNIL